MMPDGFSWDEAMTPPAPVGFSWDDAAAPADKPISEASQKTLPSAQAETLPPNQGFLSRTSEAIGSGLTGAARDVAALPGAMRGQAPKPADATKGYQQPLKLGDLLDPGQAVPKVAYQLAQSWPTLAGGIAGGTAGAAAAGPVGGVVGGAAGAAVTTAMQQMAPLFSEEMQKPGADPDHAFNVALERAGQSGLFSAIGWGAFAWSPFVAPVKNLLFQAFGVQPGVAAVERGTENIEQGRPVTEGMEGALLGATVGTAVPMAGHELVRRLTPAQTAAATPPDATASNPTVEAVQAAEAQQAARYPTPEAAAEAEIAEPVTDTKLANSPAPVSPELAARAAEGSHPPEEAEADQARAGLAEIAGVPPAAAVAPEAPVTDTKFANQPAPVVSPELSAPAIASPAAPAPVAPTAPLEHTGTRTLPGLGDIVTHTRVVEVPAYGGHAVTQTVHYPTGQVYKYVLSKGGEWVSPEDESISFTGNSLYQPFDFGFPTVEDANAAATREIGASGDTKPAEPPATPVNILTNQIEESLRARGDAVDFMVNPSANDINQMVRQNGLPGIRSVRAFLGLDNKVLVAWDSAVTHAEMADGVPTLEGLAREPARSVMLTPSREGLRVHNNNFDNGPAAFGSNPMPFDRYVATYLKPESKSVPLASESRLVEPPRPPATPKAAAPPEPVEKGAAAPPEAPTWRPAAILAELDARGAGDTAYRQAFSTFSKTPLRKGETWRQRLVDYVARGPGAEEVQPLPASTGPNPEEQRAVRSALANPKAPNSRSVIAKFRADHGDAEWQKVVGAGASEPTPPIDKSAAYGRAQAVADGWRALGDKHQAGVVERIIQKSKAGSAHPLFDENLANMEARLREAQEKAKPSEATRDAFTLQRLNRETDQMEPVTFQRGDFVRMAQTGATGEIEGISHARQEVKVGNVWYPFGAAYHTERPVVPTKAGTPLSKVVEAVNKKHGAGLTEADRVVAPEPPRAAEPEPPAPQESTPTGLTDKEKATLTALHQQLNAAQVDAKKAKTRTKKSTASEKIDVLKRKIASLQDRDVPPEIQRAPRESAPKYEGTPTQQGRQAQAAAVAKIREAASGGQGLTEAAEQLASIGAKSKRQETINKFMRGAMDQARGQARTHYENSKTQMPWEYRRGVEFAEQNPAAVHPVNVTTHTATGQQTNYRFAHPDEARATADRLERLPPRVFYQRPSDTFEAARPRLAAEVDALLARVAPGARGETGADLQGAHGAYFQREAPEGTAHVIAWALSAPDALHTVSHEAIHYLRRAGFLRPEEWATLERAAHEQGWGERTDARYSDIDPEGRTEEAIAERYADWAAGRRAGADTLVGRIFNRLNMLRQQVAALARRALGRDATAEDIFARVESGDVGRREAGDTLSGGAEQRPLVGPVKEHIVAAATDAKDWLSRTKEGFAHALFPMLAGSKPAQAFAARFANGLRASMFRFGQIDRALVKQFTPEQRAAMGRALDRQSVFEQQVRKLPEAERAAARQAFEDGKTGLAGLAPDQRAAVEALNRLSQATWERMRDAGLVKPDADGLPYYMPRQFVNAGTGQRVTALNPQGRNLNTAGPKRRQHLEWEDTEAAGKAKLGDEAELVADIRSLVHALSRNERAITGRNLVEAIRRYAPEAVQEGGQPAAGYHTLDHPSMWRWTPDVERGADGKWHEATRPIIDEDGSPVLDEHGQPQTETVFKRVPIHIHEDFRGPLNAVLSHETPDWYRSLMQVKGGVMHAIMFSPYIHFMVEMGRALPIAPGKVITGRILGDGQRFIGAKPGTAEAEWLDKQIATGGLSPIGQGWIMDPATIMEQAQTSERSRFPVVQAFKDWHQTALWDRVFKLQVGLARGMYEDAIAKGFPEDAAHVIAAHIANRYAGALPPENLSRAANMLANVALFSRSFTLGNLGVIKDMTNGAPSHTRALIEQMAGPEVAKDAQTMLRRKAVSAFTRDIALYLVGYGVLQSTVGVIRNMLDGEGPGDALASAGRDYINHVAYSLTHLGEDPTNILGVLPQMWNEPGKKGRMFMGEEEGGKGIYARLPPGKVGEEFLGWFTHPGDMALNKMSPMVRPFLELMTNRDSLDRQIMRPNPQSLGDLLTCAGQAVGHILVSQLPIGAIQGAWNLASEAAHPTMTGQQLAIEAAKLIGPATGVAQISGGHPLGPKAGYEAATIRTHEYDVQQVVPQARRMIQAGDQKGAKALMERAGMAPYEVLGVLRNSLAPQRAEVKKERTFGRIAGDAGRERAGMTTGATP